MRIRACEAGDKSDCPQQGSRFVDQLRGKGVGRRRAFLEAKGRNRREGPVAGVGAKGVLDEELLKPANDPLAGDASRKSLELMGVPKAREVLGARPRCDRLPKFACPRIVEVIARRDRRVREAGIVNMVVDDQIAS